MPKVEVLSLREYNVRMHACGVLIHIVVLL